MALPIKRTGKILFYDDERTFKCLDCNKLLEGVKEVEKHKLNKGHKHYKVNNKNVYYEI